LSVPVVATAVLSIALVVVAIRRLEREEF